MSLSLHLELSGINYYVLIVSGSVCSMLYFEILPETIFKIQISKLANCSVFVQCIKCSVLNYIRNISG